MKEFIAKYRGAVSVVLAAAAMLWLAHLGWASEEGAVSAQWGVASALVPIGMSLWFYVTHDERKLMLAVRLLTGISFAVLLLLSTSWWSAGVLALVYAVLAAWLPSYKFNRLPVAGVMQFSALWAIFLAAAVWHWPAFLILLLTWCAAVVSGYWYLDPHEDRAAWLLASTWGLIAAQCAYVFSIWLVNYILGSGWLVLPQAALVITSLGYVFGSIYSAHKKSQLGPWRLAEYLLIGLLLILIVAVGTKWTGTV